MSKVVRHARTETSEIKQREHALVEHQRRDEASNESHCEMDAAPIRDVNSHLVVDQTLLLSDALNLQQRRIYPFIPI